MMNKSMFPKSRRTRHSKGQADHVDAWLMSYADLITLLFMLFVIFISVTVTKQNHSLSLQRGEPEHRAGQHKSGTLELGTSFDEAYRTLAGFILSHDADQYIAVEKTQRGIAVDISAIEFFDEGSANIPATQVPAIQEMARIIKNSMLENSTVEVEGHTDGTIAKDAKFTGWALSGLRAARIIGLLQEAGIDPAQMRATSYAGTQPLVPNQDAGGKAIGENQRRNQRIIIRLENPN